MQSKDHLLEICFPSVLPLELLSDFFTLNDTGTSLMCRTTEIHIETKYFFIFGNELSKMYKDLQWLG